MKAAFNYMKKIITTMLVLLLMLSMLPMCIYAEAGQKTTAEYWDIYSPDVDVSLDLGVKSAILMEYSTGKILYEYNSSEALAPASVTKTMTLLLIAEALDAGRISLDETVYISAYAASMGGSQVFLKEGESMCVEDLIKCTVIASANDAAVALAEHVLGSEESFVNAMNERASELGLTSSVFENVTGLDDDVTEHTMCAYDIAVISRELLRHDVIRKYSSVWQDSIRDGEFVLTNTNRLVRYYDGCTGLKTGSTDKAGFCVSASAKKKNTELIAVVMGAQTGSERNEAARTLLDYGFSNFALYEKESHSAGNLKTVGSDKEAVSLRADGFSAVVNKADLGRITIAYELPESVHAPLSEGAAVGRAVYKIGEQIIGSTNIYIECAVEEIEFFEIFLHIFKTSFLK